ncbi:MAG TPA: hypothetical protein PK760_07695 [Flavobacteriales bacterium]|nr:hypothetical protein [Flavobacteriales bacterium]
MVGKLLCLTLLAWGIPTETQVPTDGVAAPITYARSISVPLNGLLLFDKVNEAWTWTFGKEPGAKLLLSDRDNGLIEGSARVNFRSKQLLLREESMGPIQYHVVLNVRAGECRVTVSELVHTGNKTTTIGGVHMGLLTKSPDPIRRIRGAGGGNARRLYAEVKSVADQRILAVLQAFEARLRASAEP